MEHGERVDRCSSKECTLDLSAQRIDALVGVQCESNGKLSAMHLLVGDDSDRVKFNRMSGVTRFANCQLLWINADDVSCYANVFADNERRDELTFTWHASPSQSRDVSLMAALGSVASMPTLALVRRTAPDAQPYLFVGTCTPIQVDEDTLLFRVDNRTLLLERIAVIDQQR
jgi:hypothetical protein